MHLRFMTRLEEFGARPGVAVALLCAATILAGCGIVPEAAKTGEAVQLKLNVVPGTVVRYKTTNRQSIKNGAAGLDAKTELFDQVIEAETKFVGAEQGKLNYELKVTNLSTNATDPNTRGESNNLSILLKPVEFSGTVEPNGRSSLLRIEVGAPISTGPSLSTTVTSLQGSMLGFMGMMYPSKPIYVGDKWVSTFSLIKTFERLGYKFRKARNPLVTVTYRLEKIETVGGRKQAHISITAFGEPTFIVTDEATKRSGSARQKISARSKAVIDVETGLPIRIMSETTTASALPGAYFSKDVTAKIERTMFSVPKEAVEDSRPTIKFSPAEKTGN